MGKIKDLDESKVYYLGDLSDEQLDQVCEWFMNIDANWNGSHFYLIKNREWNKVYFYRNEWMLGEISENDQTTNALELFEDESDIIPSIEDVQIDFSILTQEQRDNCVRIVIKNGVNISSGANVLKVLKNYRFFREGYVDGFWGVYSEGIKTIITYDQFVKWYDKELNPPVEFDKKSKDEQKQIVEELNNIFKKESILQEAERIINGARAEDYGDVEENFTRIADGWKVIFGIEYISPRQVAHAMTWLKICRDLNTPKRDNLVDICGYTGCIEKMENKEKV